jgi:CelD/BcsL family acetyltransferase involved in cellulose biosynthesis
MLLYLPVREARRNDGEPMKARSLAGRDVLEELGPKLDDLHTATGTPVTARRPWLQTWIASFEQYEPWAIVVEADDGSLEAAALLARRRRRGRLTHVVALGQGPSDYNRLPARTVDAARALSEAVAAELKAMPGSWALRLDQLPAGDPVARGLARRLPRAILEPGDGAPRVRFKRERTLRAHISRNAWQTEKAGWNRILRSGLTPAMACLGEPEAISQILSDVERIRRLRDTAERGRSNLEDPRLASFWRAIIVELAARGEADVYTLRLNDELAAYSLCLADDGSYRTWDGRLDPKWSRFSPGRLVDFASIRRALATDRFREFDWMRGVEDYKMRTADDVAGAEHLLAWSSAGVMLTSGIRTFAKARAKVARERHPALGRALRR